MIGSSRTPCMGHPWFFSRDQPHWPLLAFLRETGAMLHLWELSVMPQGNISRKARNSAAIDDGARAQPGGRLCVRTPSEIFWALLFLRFVHEDEEVNGRFYVMLSLLRNPLLFVYCGDHIVIALFYLPRQFHVEFQTVNLIFVNSLFRNTLVHFLVFFCTSVFFFSFMYVWENVLYKSSFQSPVCTRIFMQIQQWTKPLTLQLY